MQSKAATVAAYLASLPADRREAIEAVRRVILKNLDKDYVEGMQYGMIGYAVPHSVYPPGYHCDPRQPLPFAGLASQKSHMSIYLANIYTGYGDRGAASDAEWFRREWAKTGKKLDMGKVCIRFKRVEDLALDVIGESIRRLPASVYIARYEAALGEVALRKRSGPAKKKAAKAASDAAKKKAGGAKKKSGKKKSAAKKVSRR